MPGAGGSTRAASRYVAPWWEELDTEAFREFPTARRPRIVPADAPARPARPRPRRSAVPNGGAYARDGSAQATGGPAPATGGAARATGGPAPATGGPIAATDRPVAATDRPVAATDRPVAATDRPVAATDGRRTVTIRGYGGHPPERNLPMARPKLRRHERPGFQPDRAALWAVILGLLLIFVAAASAHAAVVHQLVH